MHTRDWSIKNEGASNLLFRNPLRSLPQWVPGKKAKLAAAYTKSIYIQILSIYRFAVGFLAAPENTVKVHGFTSHQLYLDTLCTFIIFTMNYISVEGNMNINSMR